MIDPDAVVEARRMLGRQLAAFRTAAGFNQYQLAELVHYGRSTIANVETGRQNVSRTWWQLCDEILQANGTLLEGYDKVAALDQHYRRQRAVSVPPPPHHLSATTPLAELPAPAATDAAATMVERRQALLVGIAAVAAASGLLSRAGERTHARIGVGDITRLHAVTALYRSVDYECGGGTLYQEVAQFAEAAADRLLAASYPEALRSRVLTAVAEARQLAGWTAFDAGRHIDAQRHWLAAERAAVAADDRRLAARVRYCQARQFQHLHHNQDAVQTLRLATDHLGPAATPAITAMLAGAQAASLAALGYQDEAITYLGTATDAHEHIDPDREPDWMNFFDHGEVLAQHGRVYRDLARQDPHHGPAAVRWVTEAIDAFGPQHVRSSLFNQIGLCSALFLAGEPDQAVAVGTTVLGQVHRVTSRRIVDRLANLRRDLVPHATMPDVREFSRTLTTIGASA